MSTKGDCCRECNRMDVHFRVKSSKPMDGNDDNFDDIDLDELFNDFADEPTSTARRAPLNNCDIK